MPPPRLLAYAGLLVAALAGCTPEGLGDGAGPSESAPEAPRDVRGALVRAEPWERSVSATGELLPFERVVTAAKVPGRVAELAVDRGSAVERGALLARLEAREYELRVAQAGAAVASARALLGLAADGEDDQVAVEDTSAVRLAQAELERARLERERAGALAREGVDSQAASDRAEADFRAAESRLREARELVAARRATLAQRRSELEIARAQLAETRIVAPFAGVVAERLCATGAYLSPGDPVVELVRVDPLRLVLEVSEREAALVRGSETVRARVAGRAAEIEGQVARLAPALSRASRSLIVEVEIRNPGGELLPGSFAEARVVVAPDESVPTMPAAALVSFAGLDKVFVVRDGRAEERRIQVGRREAQRLEVLAGLEVGDEVVLSPGRLATGTPVRVAR